MHGATVMQQDRPDHDTEYLDDELLNRKETAVLLSRLLHTPVAVRTVAAWPITYRLLGHGTLYRRSDVEAFAKARLANAPRCIGHISPADPEMRRAGPGRPRLAP
jgi:hypothetical protein